MLDPKKRSRPVNGLLNSIEWIDGSMVILRVLTDVAIIIILVISRMESLVLAVYIMPLFNVPPQVM